MEPRVPPHDLEAERTCLGCCLLDTGARQQVLTHTKADDYFLPAHRHIFEAFLAMERDGRHPDYVTLSTVLQAADKLIEAGGPEYIAGLTNVVPSVKNAEHYAGIVTELAQTRRLSRFGAELSERASERKNVESTELLNWSLGEVIGLSQRQNGRVVYDIEALMEQADRYHEQVRAKKRHILQTGFPMLDEKIDLLEGDLCIIGARQKQGKTAMAVNIAWNAMLQGHTVLYCTCEMPPVQLMYRFGAVCSGFQIRSFRTGYVQDMVRHPKLAELRACKSLLRIEHTALKTEVEIGRIARTEKARNPGLRLVVVDYLGLLTSERNRTSIRESMISISHYMKAMAVDLDVTVLALSQLARPQDRTRWNPRPTISEFMESSAIESDCDQAILLWPQYDKDENWKRQDQLDYKVFVDLNRNGPNATLDFIFTRPTGKFEDWKIQ